MRCVKRKATAAFIFIGLLFDSKGEPLELKGSTLWSSSKWKLAKGTMTAMTFIFASPYWSIRKKRTVQIERAHLGVKLEMEVGKKDRD